MKYQQPDKSTFCRRSQPANEPATLTPRAESANGPSRLSDRVGRVSTRLLHKPARSRANLLQWLMVNWLSIGVALPGILSLGGCHICSRHEQQQQATDARALTYQGVSALERGQPMHAEQLLADAEKLAPNDPRIHQVMADCLLEQGQVFEAIQRAEQALRISPNEPDLNIQLGRLYLLTGQYERARRRAEKAIEVKRNRCDGWQLLGEVHLASGSYQTALDHFHRACQDEDLRPKLQQLMAETYLRIDEPHKALALVDRACQHYPQGREPTELVALEASILLQVNQPDRAVARVQSIIERDDLDADAWYIATRAYAAASDQTNAKLAATIGLERFPQDNRFGEILQTADNPLYPTSIRR